MLSAARRSRFGVSAPLAPRKPTRSARVEQSVISTRLVLDTAAAKERLIKIRLTPAANFRIMTVSVEAAPALIKSGGLILCCSLRGCELRAARYELRAARIRFA